MTSYQCVAADGTVVCFREAESGESIEFYAARSGRKTHWIWRLDDKWSHAREAEIAKDPDPTTPEIVRAAKFMLQYEDLYLRQAVQTTRLWGHRYPRMWRGRYNPRTLSSSSPVKPHTYREIYTRSVVAAASLFEELEAVFKYVEPATVNLSAYGHRFRELIILACTEVEACLRGVLCANTPSDKHKNYYNMKRYARLGEPMRLSEWSVVLKDYPVLSALSPFGPWSDPQDARPLGWYQAYNGIKHNREGEFDRATLGCAIEAMAAVFVMECAQWGPEVYSPFHANRSSPFIIEKHPLWTVPDFYAPDPQQPNQWTDDLYFS